MLLNITVRLLQLFLRYFLPYLGFFEKHSILVIYYIYIFLDNWLKYSYLLYFKNDIFLAAHSDEHKLISTFGGSSVWSVGVVLPFWCAVPPGWLSDDPAGSLESSQLRPHGLAWLKPSWCDSQAEPGGPTSGSTRLSGSDSVSLCALEQVYEHLIKDYVCVCACARAPVCVCVCSRLLPPTGWSFTFRTGRRDRRLPGCARSLGTVRLAVPGIH